MDLTTFIVGAHEPVRMVTEKEEREENSEHFRDAYLSSQRMRRWHGGRCGSSTGVARVQNVNEYPDEAEDDNDVGQQNEEGNVDEDLQLIQQRAA